MNRASLAAALAVALLLGTVSPGIAADEARAEEERLLGSDGDDVRFSDYLPFTRQIAATGTVSGSFEASTTAAGVPAAAMLEAWQAFGTSIDFARDLRDGDRFYVRYEQTFTAAGAPLDVGRVLWAELRTAAKGTVAIHRFRTRDGAERFWLVNGQAATPPSLRLPVDVISVSSGFGLRADPFDQPPPPPTAGKSGAMGGPLRQPPALPPGLKAGTIPGETPLTSSAGLSSYGGFRTAPPPRATRALFMHEGVDLVAPAGAPVYAAADGVVVGAGPNGRYGNWIRIEHSGRLATAYGHLSRIALGVEAGGTVVRGELIGFVGSTGRSTGAHLHFELLSNGKPVNPINHPELKRGMLRGPDLERLRRQVAQSLAERDRETAAARLFSD